ncbi:MAG TPA: ATP-binding protein [Candidatus Dormibacteraeota bacterium]|nr:ATP-binding protein [Candidatus Dormibacteraeota bacterium]
MPSTKSPSERQLRAELKRVQAHVTELEATIKAIRSGQVDGIVVEGPQGSHIFTLQSSEEPYRIIAERMNEGAATLSAEGIILFCNHQLSEMARRPAEQLLGSTLLSILRDGSREDFPELMKRALTENVRTPGSLLRPDGSMLPVQLSLSPIPFAESEQGVCLVATDLTDQKHAQDEVHRLNAGLEQQVALRTAELEAANQELEAFTYAVAHDLRAPLRHIHGFSDLLQRDSESALSADGRHSLDCILTGTMRMEKLLEALLNLSRFGRQSVQRQKVDLNKLVREVIDDLAPDLKNQHIDWKIRDLPVAHCDLALMKIVFANLLSNAVKFTRLRAAAVIEIGQTMADGAPVFFVRDNGAGFEMRYASKLFGVFQRLHRAEEFEGTGVGLATVQRILQKHGGSIWAEAEPDKGATFYFTCDAAETTTGPTVAVEEVV